MKTYELYVQSHGSNTLNCNIDTHDYEYIVHNMYDIARKVYKEHFGDSVIKYIIVMLVEVDGGLKKLLCADTISLKGDIIEKTVKEYKLYVFPMGAHDRRKCVLVDDNYEYMVKNMSDTAERIYHDTFEHSDFPLMSFALFEVYDDGSEEPLEAGKITFGKYMQWKI